MTPLIAVFFLAGSAALRQTTPGETYEPSPPGLPGNALALLDTAPYLHDAPVVSAALSPDGRHLLSLDSEGFLNGWECPSARRLYRRQVLDSGHFRRRISFFKTLSQLLRLLFIAALGLAQFMLDRFELRTQVSPPLRIGKLRRDIFLKSLLDLRNLELR